MRVLVVGGHGQVGRKLLPILGDEGHEAVAMIRDPDQAPEVRALGAEPVTGDLEGSFETCLEGCDALVFTAGSGAGTGALRTALVDGLGAIRAVNAAREQGVRRFVMVSSLGTDDPDRHEALRHYLVAKAIADGYLERSGLDHTILRPGQFTDDDPTGLVELGEEVGWGSVPRGDVAHVAALCLTRPNTVGRTLELVAGEEPVEAALRAV